MPSITPTSILDVLVILSSFAAFLAIRDYQRRRGLPYPPGPRPLPLIGNLFDIPKEFSWLTYTQLSKKYGVVYFALRVFWQPDERDGRRYHIFLRLGSSRRRIEFSQSKQRPPRETS